MIMAARIIILLAASMIFLDGAIASDAANSGFMPAEIYAKMTTDTAPSGTEVRRWYDPDIRQRGYQAIIVETVKLYPKDPKPTPEVSASTLRDLSAKTTGLLRSEIGKTIKVVQKPAAGTLRFRSAITAVATENKKFRARELLPIALIFAAGQFATGTRAQEAVVQFEWELFDAETNRLLAAGVRRDTGEVVEKVDDKVKVSADHLQAAVERWAGDAHEAFAKLKNQ